MIDLHESMGPELGSNSRPLDLQSDSHLLPDTLPTALCGPVCNGCGVDLVWLTSLATSLPTELKLDDLDQKMV